MEPQFINTATYGILAGLATITGIYMVLHRQRWATENSVFFISFSAGVILTIAFLHLLPEAIDTNRNALFIVLITLISFYILEHMLVIHSCKEGECEVHPIGILAFIGLCFHSLLDGIVIGVGFEAGFSIGIVASMGVLLHEIPEGITITSILLHAGYTRKRAVVFGYIVGFATPLGAMGSYFFIRDVTPETLGILLAVAAGSFTYIGASDLLPETHKNFRKGNILLVLSGMILVYIVALLLGE